QDVQNAKANTAAAAAAVAQVQALIDNLKGEVAAAQDVAAQKQGEYDAAKRKLDEATATAQAIQAQADASKQEAATAARNAGQIVSQMFKTSGSDMTVSIFLESDPSQVDQLLSKLGNLNRVASRANDVYTKAVIASKNAEALSKQAAKAQEERGKLEATANQALAAAQAAQSAAEQALATQEEKGIELAQQLAFLQSTENETAAAYQRGVEEARRLAEEARQGGALPAGWLSGQGWANPAYGRLSDGYGPREVICSSGGCSGSFHYGQDIATGCDASIRTASDGRVVAAGYSGTYGNRIKIDHGGGIYSLYAHLRYGGIEVNVGDYVSAGQEIGRSGTTGASTGCHLHFEIWNGDSRINPYSFMADRGVPLG
ncbi:MAG TPA: M23 family metallopeptidase, partial [Microbacteriaceae bacterium]|nr:M23 family metallopeptidase [Microbacteriaceae bacterium]